MLSEVDKAYLAGIVDGEGCIYISEVQGRYFQLKLIIVGTIEHHMTFCADLAGVGSLHYSPQSGNRADKWQWHVSAQEAAWLLESILPYLRLKDEQARLALQFYKHMEDSPSYNSRHPIPRQVLEYRRMLASVLKEPKKNNKVYDGALIEVESPINPWHQERLI